MSTTASTTDNVTTTGSETALVTTTTSTTSTTTPMTLESATKLVESSKEIINQCDQQSSLYKAALRQITSSSSSSSNNTDNNNNIVIIKLSKVDPSTTQKEVPSKLVLQLSSPVEEATLYPNKKQPSSEQVTFTSVETGQATISITAYWENNNNNNESETNYIDVSKFTHELLDVLQSPKQYQTTIVVPLYVKKQSTKTTNDSMDNDIVLCTITFDIVYTPSYKDIREELCNCIGKIATQKAIAREELRKASLQVHALSSSSSSSGSNKPTTKPAVKSGFLNKDSKDIDNDTNTTGTTAQQQEDGKLSSKLYQFYQVWYNRMMFTVPIVKNYIFFVSFTIVSHYYGHHLAIPPPV